jgi:hypothetical protein
MFLGESRVGLAFLLDVILSVPPASAGGAKNQRRGLTLDPPAYAGDTDFIEG